MRVVFIAIGCCLCCLCSAQMTLISYNVENLFHPTTDSVNQDVEYMPQGSRRWSYTRYFRKVEQVARVIANSVEDGCPAIVALNEVEDRRCLEDLCRKMPHYPYRIVHYDSPDHRGIDVAMLYDSTRCKLLQTQRLRPLDKTREVLYVQYAIGKDTLHVFACHLPSQLGGYAASQPRRDTVKAAIVHVADSVLGVSRMAKIIVCGDMNMAPKEDMTPLHNLMLSMPGGTHKYQGIWTCLDQFYVSESLLPEVQVEIYDAPWLQEEDTKYLGSQPKRTFRGFRYNRTGFSDHLPILLQIGNKIE